MKALAEGVVLCRGAIELPPALIASLVAELLDPQVSHDSKAEFLRAFTDKGETAPELAAFAQELLPLARPLDFSGDWNGAALLDCCGTGGGGLPLFNVSTGMVFVLAALGVPVVKHGNRGVTKKSGSADVLEALGIRVDVTPDQARRCLEEVGAVFFYAPLYHPAFATIAPVRKQLGVEGRRTVFNLLGPVLNPARPAAQISGVFRPEQLELYDETLRFLGRKRHAVVLGRDAATGRSIGEVSITGTNEFRGNVDMDSWTLPVLRGDLTQLEVATAEESAARILDILEGRDTGLGRELLGANAGIALCVQGHAQTLDEAMSKVRYALNSGRAAEKVKQWREFSAKIS